MPVLWPRNIVPYDERKVKALGSVDRVALYMAAIDAPLDEAALSTSERADAEVLLEAGLLARKGGTLVPTNRHSRDPLYGVPGQLEHKMAKLQYAKHVINSAGDAIAQQGVDAQAGIGVVTLPDTPDALSIATGILAEAEDQLRALAETAEPDHGRKVRVMIFVGSVPMGSS